MKKREMVKLIRHFDTYFCQNDSLVLHPVTDDGLHIDVLLYRPSAKYPFWKLVTMGASDYQMPAFQPTISRYNEYIMFLNEDEDLTDREVVSYYHSKLMMIASYACENKQHITFGHSLEWQNQKADDDAVGAFVLFPELIENSQILRCKVGRWKTVACLQTILLDRRELDMLAEMGPQAFWNEYVYPPLEEESDG